MVQMEHLDLLSRNVSKALARPDIRERHVAASRAAALMRDVRAEQAALRPVPEEVKKLIIDLYRRGWLLSEIAREIGAPKAPNSGRARTDRIKTVLRHAGLFMKGRRPSAKVKLESEKRKAGE